MASSYQDEKRSNPTDEDFDEIHPPVPTKSRRSYLLYAVAILLGYNLYLLGSSHGVAVVSKLGYAQHIKLTPAPATFQTGDNQQFFFPGPHEGELFHSGPWNQSESWKLPRVYGTGHDQCLTYKERYEAHRQPLPPSLRKANPKSNTALVLKTQPWQLLEMHPDFELYIRSVITEVEVGVGMDVILLADRSKAWYDPNWLQNVQEEFRGRVVEILHEDIVTHFPGAIPLRSQDDHLPDLWSRSHSVVSYLMDLPDMQRYDFVWSLERDARLAGGSWPQFFNLLNASLTHINNPNPDLVLFGPSWPEPDSTSDRLKGCVGAFADPSSAMKASLHFLGFSRAYLDQIISLQKQGMNCWDEQFVPTVGKQFDFKMEWISMPIYYHDSDPGATTTYDCCAWGAGDFYRSWRDDPKDCREGPTLLHAFKEEYSSP